MYINKFLYIKYFIYFIYLVILVLINTKMNFLYEKE